MSVCGCAIWPKPSSVTEEVVAEQPVPERIHRDTITLDIALVDRSITDPLLGKTLWDDVDEIGAIDPLAREILNKNGFRIGVAGSSMPPTLQTLLDTEEKHGGDRPANIPPVTLFAGGDTLISARTNIEHCSIREAHRETAQQREFTNATCMLRVKVRKLQEGWAKLEFTPEIHYGQMSLRHQAKASGWEFKNSQRILPLYNQKFDITLNEGEIAVISATDDQLRADSVGNRYFVDDAHELRRLIVIRLGGMGEVEGVSSRLVSR